MGFWRVGEEGAWDTGSTNEVQRTDDISTEKIVKGQCVHFKTYFYVEESAENPESGNKYEISTYGGNHLIDLFLQNRGWGGVGWHGLIVPATEGKWYCCGISLIHSPKSPHIVLSNPEFSAWHFIEGSGLKMSFVVFLFSSRGKDLNIFKRESSNLQIFLIFKATIFVFFFHLLSWKGCVFFSFCSN